MNVSCQEDKKLAYFAYETHINKEFGVFNNQFEIWLIRFQNAKHVIHTM